jgi:hypothetical protein
MVLTACLAVLHLLLPCSLPAAVNFDEDRFLTMLSKAEEYEAYLRAALQAKGVAAPQLPSSAELGWTGDLPHPMAYQYPGSGDIDLLRHQAKQVRCLQDMHAYESA